MKHFLKLAFKLKDKEKFQLCLNHISDLIEFCYKHGHLRKFFELSKIKLPFISRLSAAVASRDSKDIVNKNILKFLIDYSLRLLIQDEETHFFSNLGYWFKTNLAREKAIRAREKVCLEFQKDLYKTYGLDTDPKNVGKIFRFQREFNVLTEVLKSTTSGTLIPSAEKTKAKPDHKKILAELKDAISKRNQEALISNAAKIRDLLKAAFLEDHIPHFQVIMTGLMDCIKFGCQDRKEDTIATILDIMTRSGYDIHETEEEYPTITPVELAFFLDLVTRDNRPAVYFSLLNYLNFQSFLGFNKDPKRTNRICSFKIYALEEFTKCKTLLNSSEVDKLMKRCNESCNELDLKNYSESYYSSDLLDLYTKFLILSSQIDGERERKAHRELLKMLNFEVSLIRKVHQAGMFSIFKLIVQRGEHTAKLQAIVQNDPSLLYWMVMNNNDFQYYADRNEISSEAWIKLKRTLYGYIALTLQHDEPEILRNKEAILQDFASLARNKEAIRSHKKLDLLIFEAKALFKERYEAGEVKDFKELLEDLIRTILPLKSNSILLSKILELDAEELRDFSNILQHEKYGLALKLALESEGLLNGPYEPIRYHRNDKSDFRIQVMEAFAKHQQCLLPHSAEALLKGNLDLVQSFDYDNPKYPLISLEVEYQLKDAYFNKNDRKYAEIIHSICKFMEQIYQEGNSRALIHLFELHPLKFDDMPVFQAESGETVSKIINIRKTHLSLVDTMRRLMAKDSLGLAKHLVDHFIRKQQRSFIGIPNGTEFTLAIYQNLNIQPLDFLCLNKEVNAAEVSLITESLRKTANLGTDLKKYEQTIEYLSKHGIVVNALRPPEALDSYQYKELYKKMKQLWIEHRVAHRFGILDAELEGSCTTTMASELQTACLRFKNSDVCVKVLGEINAALKGISEKEWHDTIEKLSQDIQDIFIDRNPITLAQKVSKKELIAIPVFIQSCPTDVEQWAHLTGALFFHYKKADYCILSDRGGVISESDFGITLYKIGTPEQIATAAANLMNSEKSDMTVKDFRTTIDSLNLTKVYHIKKKHQKSGNCGWSSSAKMLGYGIKFVNFLNLIGILNPERDDIAADFAEAQKLTQPLYKAFSNFDRKDILEQYQTDCSIYQITPNVLLLAQILLRSEHRPQRKEIVERIRCMNLIQDVHREAAFNTLLKASEHLVVHKLGLKKRGIEADRKLLSEHAKLLLEAYLAYKSEEELDKLIDSAVKAIKAHQPELFKGQDACPTAMTSPLLLSGSLALSEVGDKAPITDTTPKSDPKGEKTEADTKKPSEAIEERLRK